MISNFQNIPPQTKPKELNTCLHNNTNRNSSPLLVESPTSKMSSISTSVGAPAANKNQITNPPMEAVIVNSIIYSKPSFCRISVDLGDVSANKKTAGSAKVLNGSCFSETSCRSSVESKSSSLNFDAVSCLAGMDASSSLGTGEDTKLYRMCTTLNGSIHHQISDLCDNILAMAGFYSNTSSEADDDSFIEFAYGDESNEDYKDDGEDDYDDEDDEEDCCGDDIDDDNDVVDFAYDCPIRSSPKLYCDKRKKVLYK